MRLKQLSKNEFFVNDGISSLPNKPPTLNSILKNNSPFPNKPPEDLFKFPNIFR